jgi:hypothetical protein
MTVWEKKIVNAFLDRSDGEKNFLRLRSISIYPGFDSASADEKESYLEAAESLEQKGLLVLKWEKWGRGERLKTLTCPDIQKLFEAAGKKNPVFEAEEIRSMIKEKIALLEKKYRSEKTLSFLRYFADNFSPADARRGKDSAAMNDFLHLVEIFFEPEKWKNTTTRALSIQLYNDSKRLETLLDFTATFLLKAQRDGISTPDFSFLKRSFPETMIAGKLIFEFTDDANDPLVNTNGIIFGFPVSSTEEIKNIRTISAKEKPAVLTIENKETFYALSTSGGIAGYDCCLYTAYANRAAAALIRLLAASGFSFFHAGDLDPAGILILQNIREIAEKPVLPVRMDAATHTRYLPWARPLNQNMLAQISQINEETRAIPGITELIRRIEETRRGVEQEIIDYRG